MTSNYSRKAIYETAKFLCDTCTLHDEWNFIDERPMRQIEATKCFFQCATEDERCEIITEALYGKTRKLAHMTMGEFWYHIEKYLERTLDDDVSDVAWEIHKEREWAA